MTTLELINKISDITGVKPRVRKCPADKTYIQIYLPKNNKTNELRFFSYSQLDEIKRVLNVEPKSSTTQQSFFIGQFIELAVGREYNNDAELPVIYN